MYSKKRQLGNLGEEIAKKFLVKRGFKILEQNYLKKWGELDIVAKFGGILRFVEVKTTTLNLESVSLETSNKYRPEEKVHEAKLKRICRAIETYLCEKDVSHETPWQIDVIVVYLDPFNKKARVKFIENVVM